MVEVDINVQLDGKKTVSRSSCTRKNACIPPDHRSSYMPPSTSLPFVNGRRSRVDTCSVAKHGLCPSLISRIKIHICVVEDCQ
jgi:hypothetical protein